jgi:hypothetical protein
MIVALGVTFIGAMALMLGVFAGMYRVLKLNLDRIQKEMYDNQDLIAEWQEYADEQKIKAQRFSDAFFDLQDTELPKRDKRLAMLRKELQERDVRLAVLEEREKEYRRRRAEAQGTQEDPEGFWEERVVV